MPAAIITMSAWAEISRFENLSKPYVKKNNPKDPYISPVYGEYQKMPRMLIQVGDEPVTEDSYLVYEKASEANVDVTISKYDNMPHVFQNLSLEREEVTNAWLEVGSFIKEIFNNEK